MSWNRGKGNELKGQVNITVEELRSILGVPESYKWDNFNKQVLLLTKKELKEKANIRLVISNKKTSRRITHLKITFEGQPS